MSRCATERLPSSRAMQAAQCWSLARRGLVKYLARYACVLVCSTDARYSGDGAARRPATLATTVCSPVLCELTIYMTAIAYTVNTYSKVLLTPEVRAATGATASVNLHPRGDRTNEVTSCPKGQPAGIPGCHRRQSVGTGTPRMETGCRERKASSSRTLHLWKCSISSTCLA